jgi:tetratricopeptide (TPR) repeat protein
VNEEIARFKALGRGAQIYCLIVDGEPHALQRGLASETECFPPALLCEGDTSEPIAADARDGGDGKHHAKLKVIAGMLNVGLDELVRRDLQRRNRRLVWISAASTAGVVMATALAGYAWFARSEAEASRMSAQREAETARRTTQFMVGLFSVVDPGEARGRSVTAHEILERGVGTIERDLSGQPEVQATLMQTMGRVFTGLGLYRRSVELFEKALRRMGGGSGLATVSTQVALGDALYLEGEYDAAEVRYRKVIGELPELPWSSDRSSAVNGLADVLTQKGDLSSAIAMYKEALQNDVAAWGDVDVRAARTSSGLATAQAYAEDLTDADASFQRALAGYRAALGPDHPKVAETIHNLGSVRYFSGDPDGAAKYYREALPLYRRLYGDSHPEVAGILNNLGRIELERRNVGEATNLLEESVTIDRKLGRSDHDDFVFALDSLGMAYRSRGDRASAERLFTEAEVLAARYEHRMWGPILVNETDLRCAGGDTDGFVERLDQAALRIRKSYPNDPWRMAILESVRGLCLSFSGNREEGERLLLASLPVIEARWGKDALFTYDARRRLATHYERANNPSLAKRYRD